MEGSPPAEGTLGSVKPERAADPLSVLKETQGTAIAYARLKVGDRIAALEDALRQRDETIRILNDRMAGILATRSWRLAMALSRFSGKLLPLGSRRRCIVGRAVRTAWRCWKRLSGTADAPYPPESQEAFIQWMNDNEPRGWQLARQRKARFARTPRISIVVPVYNTPIGYLRAMIDSVLAQTYGNWELCLADGASPDKEVAQILEEYARREPRIRLSLLPENRGIAGNTNAALELATGDYVALLDHDDTLAPFALFEVVRAVNDDPELEFIYSDEDLLDEYGCRYGPHFKPDWSPDTLLSHNYICHLVVVRGDVMKAIGGLRLGFDGSQDYDLVLRATERSTHIHHIAKLLYHWRRHPAAMSNGDGKYQAYRAAKKAITEHLGRLSVEAAVNDGLWPSTYDIRWAVPGKPLVSIVIPNHDHADMLARCLESIAQSTYDRYEILIIENRSLKAETFEFYRTLQDRPEVRIIPWDERFNFAKLNNFAATHARGEVLLFLNNDTEAQNPDWLERMLEQAMRPEVGAVGAKLLYPSGEIQHAGLIVGIQGVAGHSHKHYAGTSPGYRHRLIVTQNLTAVTGACVMLRKDVFEKIGGFDERLVVAFNDVDLCMRVRHKGYRVIWTPYASLTHYESKTRGPEDNPEKRSRLEKEAHIFTKTWRKEINKGDPYYNPNLTLTAENFALRV